MEDYSQWSCIWSFHGIVMGDWQYKNISDDNKFKFLNKKEAHLFNTLLEAAIIRKYPGMKVKKPDVAKAYPSMNYVEIFYDVEPSDREIYEFGLVSENIDKMNEWVESTYDYLKNYVFFECTKERLNY